MRLTASGRGAPPGRRTMTNSVSVGLTLDASSGASVTRPAMVLFALGASQPWASPIQAAMAANPMMPPAMPIDCSVCFLTVSLLKKVLSNGAHYTGPM